MSQFKLLKKDSYSRWIEILMKNQQVYAPVKQAEHTYYKKISTAREITEDYIIPNMSVKSFVFPKIEKLFSYTKSKDGVQVESRDLEAIPHKIVLGVRPCDAMGINNMSAIFLWDPEDPIFKKRKEHTTIVSCACSKSDDYCFCTSIGGDPGNTTGSDILLVKTEQGDYVAEIITSKGEAIVNLAPQLFEEIADFDKGKCLADVPVRFDDSEIENMVQKSFDTPVFDDISMKCIGCGACAFVCPVCACFDIQDEAKGSSGHRIRVWDSCGLKQFTLHTSGHNPRETQGSRYRQRLMHKLSYMPERLGVRGCVGCGRCSRSCPVDINIADGLHEITETAK